MYESMQYQNSDAVQSAMVRVGIVTAVDEEKRLAQVYFRDMDLPSGWLPVLINRDIIGSDAVRYDDAQWTQTDTEWTGDRSGFADYADHRHRLAVRPWMPKVNDQVLCLYEPVRNGRGFVLGGIQTWQ